jgi:hypothetical protein
LDVALNGTIVLEIHGEKIYFDTPEYHYDNILASKRKLYLDKHAIVLDPSSNLRAVVTFGCKPQKHLVDGIITELPDFVDVHELIEQNKKRKVDDKLSLHKMVNKDLKNACDDITVKNFEYAKKKGKLSNLNLYSKISGSWVGDFFIDGEKYWDKMTERYNLIYDKDPLPSDSRFRNDLLWFKANDLKIAQKWKYRYEEIYRNERNTRNKLKKKK